MIELADLVAFRQVGVEITLAHKQGVLGNARANGQSKSNGHIDSLAVEHRQHAGQAGVNRTNMAVGLWAITSICRRKDFALRLESGVDFQPDDRLPLHQFTAGGRR